MAEHPFYPGGTPKMNHVALSVPAEQLDEAGRADLCRYFKDGPCSSSTLIGAGVATTFGGSTSWSGRRAHTSAYWYARRRSAVSTASHSDRSPTPI